MWGRLIVGLVLCAVGAVWLGQGVNLIHGSFMSGETFWAVVGGVLLGVGATLLLSATRGRQG